MTPKEKAKELLEKFEDIKTLHFWAEYENNNILLINQAKICALIAVDEIIKERYFHNKHYKQNSKLKYHIEIELAERLEATRNYWNEVKQEIELL